MSESDFYKNVDKINLFKDELKNLILKYNISIKKMCEYGADDEICNDVKYISIGDFKYSIQTLNEIIEESFN
jgi:hypothetical protein